MAKPMGSRNFTHEEGAKLAELAAGGLSWTEASKLLGRSYWTVRAHSLSLGISFSSRIRRNSRAIRTPNVKAEHALLRQVLDGLILEIIASGWSSGMAAIELEIDDSTLWKHSKRLEVKWPHYNRSVRGKPVKGVRDLQRLRAKIAKLAASKPSVGAA